MDRSSFGIDENLMANEISTKEAINDDSNIVTALQEVREAYSKILFSTQTDIK